MKQPAEKYIKRPGATYEPLQLRIDSGLKTEVRNAAKGMDTSLNRFAEAALSFYLEALKKRGKI